MIIIIFLVMSNNDNHDTLTLFPLEKIVDKKVQFRILNTFFFQGGVSRFLEMLEKKKKNHIIIFLYPVPSASPGSRERTRVQVRPEFKKHSADGPGDY